MGVHFVLLYSKVGDSLPPKALLGLTNKEVQLNVTYDGLWHAAHLYDYSFLLSIFLISGFGTRLKYLKNRDNDLCDHGNFHS